MCHPNNIETSTEIKRKICEPPPQYPCSSCNYACTNSSNLKKHLRTHSGEKPYSCKICEYNCCDSSNLKKHLKKHSHVTFIAPNDIMETNLRNSKLLSQKKKTMDKKFVCNICDYNCMQKFDLRRHTRTHTGEKPYKCHQCDYKTLVKGNLTKHIRKHTGEIPYACDVCDYTCRDSSNLKKHMRIHTGERPYSCCLCGFKSSCQTNLSAHMKTHNSENKRFSCDKCNYKTIRAIDLKRHMKIHGDKPHTCKIGELKCDKADHFKKTHSKRNLRYYEATTANELKLHSKMHTYGDNIKNDVIMPKSKILDESRNFACSICDHKCVTGNDLQSHVESHAEHYLQNFKHYLDA